MPLNAWPSLLTALFHYISDPEVHAFSKVASLEVLLAPIVLSIPPMLCSYSVYCYTPSSFPMQALGYMCDTMDPEKVESSVVYQILTSIVDGMRADRHNDIRYAAVKALNNSLCFTETIFSMKAERDAILQAVCEATQSTDVKIRTCAFECFASIADLYYSKLETYIEAIFTLTLTAIRTDEPAVGMQAIEFWSIICEHECSLLEDIEDGNAQPNELFRFAQVAAGPLVPLLLECMTKQDDDFEDNDVWDIATASAKLLESIALTIADSVVDLVVPFISQNINSADWRLKEASLMAFAVILDGPSEARLSPFISQAMSILINCLMDQNILVRDTSAWAIAKICQLHKSSLTSNLLPPLVAALSRILEDPAHRVILQGCFAVHNLSEACSDENEAQSNVLSHFMPQLLQKLLAITQRTDFENESEIRITAYEAINLMVANSALDMHPMIVHLLTETLGRLELSFNPQLDAQERNHLQSHLSSLIGEIVKKLDQATIAPFCDRVMMMLLKVFELKGSIAHEDAMLAMGHIAEKMEGGFIRYAQHVQAPLLTGLKSIDEAQLVTISVGFVGDLCRSLGAAVKPFCDEIVGCLLQLLQAQKVNRSAKPHVIAVFSDIAMAIEGDFDRYAVVVLNILKQAGEINISGDDEDLIDYINTLRHSILDTYTGILHV
jgi:importin subunit beta-1